MNCVVVYPYIVPDTRWLKLAALCWDTVYRLTSREAPPDPQEIQDLNGALGRFLEALYPEDFSAVGTDFKKWLVYGKGKHAPPAISRHPDDYFAMFTDKLPVNKSIMRFLVNNDLIRPRRRGSPASVLRRGLGALGLGDTLVREDIALHYLSLVASKMAEKRKADLFAETSEFTDAVFYTSRVARSDVATAILTAHLPEDLPALALERIAELRSELATGRLKFQKDVQSLVDEYSAVASEGELEKVRGTIIAIAKERIEQTRRAYRLTKLSTVVKTIGVSLAPPALLTTVASALGIGLFTPASIGAALALFGAQTLSELKKAKLEKEKAAWSYVLNVERATRGAG